MNATATKAMFTPADPYDPTLTAEGLDDFFAAQIPPETDPTLDASSLEEFFPERETFDDRIDDLFETPRPLLTLVPPREEPADIPVQVECVPVQVEYEEVAVPDPEPAIAAAAELSAPEVSVSSVQRAVMDFERFAATFHAFASECQGLRTF